MTIFLGLTPVLAALEAGDPQAWHDAGLRPISDNPDDVVEVGMLHETEKTGAVLSRFDVETLEPHTVFQIDGRCVMRLEPRYGACWLDGRPAVAIDHEARITVLGRLEPVGRYVV